MYMGRPGYIHVGRSGYMREGLGTWEWKTWVHTCRKVWVHGKAWVHGNGRVHGKAWVRGYTFQSLYSEGGVLHYITCT